MMSNHQKTGKALSILQPWAWCIVQGHKPVENRTWQTKVRGWIGIHAGKGFDRDGYDWIKDTFDSLSLPAVSDFERGGIVGRARLVDCVDRNHDVRVSWWFFGPYGFLLDDAEPLPFWPCRGKLGFFRPDPITWRYEK